MVACCQRLRGHRTVSKVRASVLRTRNCQTRPKLSYRKASGEQFSLQVPLTCRCLDYWTCCLWNVPSREIAGRSSAPSGDRYCSLTSICLPKLRFFLRQEMLYKRRNVSVGCSARYRRLRTSWELLDKTWIFLGNSIYCSCFQWLYDDRSLGVLSAGSFSSIFIIFCQHITLDGSIRRTFQPRAGVNFVLKFDENARASVRKNFCFIILMGT